MTSVTIPNSVATIGEGVFQNCPNLTNVIIGSGLGYIDSGAFSSCPNLTTAFFQGNAPGYNNWGDGGVDGPVFGGDPATVLSYQGATGWSSNAFACYYHSQGSTNTIVTFAGLPVVVVATGPVPPSITMQPQDALVNAYDPVSFNVTVTGAWPWAYQWVLNNSNIVNATSSSLVVPQVEQSTLGAYVCVVTNAYGAVTSSVANLYMYPFLANPFTGLVTYWGQTNTLSVGAWGSDLTYQWYDNGVAVLNATNSTLILDAIQFTNAGLYSVVVSSPLGNVTNPPYQVVVNAANVSLSICPNVVIQGTVGYSYIIESTTNLGDTNSWTTITNLTLTQPTQYWDDISTDTTQSSNPHKFYRVLPGQ